MDEDDHDEGKEVTRVNVDVAVHVEEHADEESHCCQMHQKAEHEVERLELILEHRLVVLDRNARVYDDAEGDEVAPLGQEQKNKDANEICMSELVDAQIHNKEEHYAEERLHFGPAFDDFLV